MRITQENVKATVRHVKSTIKFVKRCQQWFVRAIGFTHAIFGTSYVSFIVVKKLTIANKLEIDTFVTFASISGHIIAICGVSYAFNAICC